MKKKRVKKRQKFRICNNKGISRGTRGNISTKLVKREGRKGSKGGGRGVKKGGEGGGGGGGGVGVGGEEDGGGASWH